MPGLVCFRVFEKRAHCLVAKWGVEHHETSPWIRHCIAGSVVAVLSGSSRSERSNWRIGRVLVNNDIKHGVSYLAPSLIRKINAAGNFFTLFYFILFFIFFLISFNSVSRSPHVLFRYY